MGHTRTYALQGKAPGWMYIAPIQPLTHDQWKAAEVLLIESEIVGYMTCRQIADKAYVSVSVVQRAIKKLEQMGLVKRLSGGRAPRYGRKLYHRP